MRTEAWLSMSCMTNEEVEALNMALDEVQKEILFLIEHFIFKLDVKNFIKLNDALISVMKAKIGETEG